MHKSHDIVSPKESAVISNRVKFERNIHMVSHKHIDERGPVQGFQCVWFQRRKVSRQVARQATR